MDGILPLLEGFLAFALTMVALTAGVSSVLAAIQRTARWRSKGLRRLVLHVYDRDVRALARDAKVKLPEVPLTRDEREADPACLDLSRAEFTADMTALPMLDPAARWDLLDVDGAGCDRKAVIEGTGYRSLGLTLDQLTEEEFVTRLKGSDVGAWIRRVHADGDEAKADRKFAQMKQSFAVYGRAESEAFARRSRTWTIWLGFLGAFLLNIDSFSLLNGYLSDPAARVRVLGLQARILEGDLSRMPEAGTGEAERKVQEAQQRVVDAARAIQGSGLVPPEVRDELEEVVEAAETAQEAFDEAAATARSTLLLATTMTETFNIGWTLYPNCYEGSTDLRCMDLRRRLAAKAPAKPATQPATPPATQPGTPPASKPMVLAAVQPAAPAPGLLSHLPFLETLGFVVANDGAGFLRWFAGVFVTGILLGLGTPFWVQVFNNLLKMRNLLPNAGGGARQPRPGVPAGPVEDQAPAGQPQVR